MKDQIDAWCYAFEREVERLGESIAERRYNEELRCIEYRLDTPTNRHLRLCLPYLHIEEHLIEEAEWWARHTVDQLRNVPS